MILKVAVLDYKTIKPYLTMKNLLIVLGVTFFLAYVNKNTLIPLSIVSVFVTIYLSYPFAVGEQNGIDPLYRILGLTRKEVVLGRYLWAFSMNLIGILFGLLLSFLLSLLLSLPFEFKEAVAMLLGLFLPFATVRIVRYRLQSVEVAVLGDLDRIVGAERERVGAFGEEAADLFDLDIGI